MIKENLKNEMSVIYQKEKYIILIEENDTIYDVLQNLKNSINDPWKELGHVYYKNKNLKFFNKFLKFWLEVFDENFQNIYLYDKKIISADNNRIADCKYDIESKINIFKNEFFYDLSIFKKSNLL